MKFRSPDSRQGSAGPILRISDGMTRRQLLRVAGTSAAAAAFASPFLNVRAKAYAQTGTQPLRLICWPLMNGAEYGNFYPKGDASQLSIITEPLRKWANLVTFIDGVNVSGAQNHQAIRATYSGGSVSSYTSPNPVLKSVDILIADKIMATAPTPLKALHIGVIPADSITYYQRGQNIFFFDQQPVDYEANPVTAFDRLYPGQGAGGGAAPGPTAPGAPQMADLSSDSLDLLDAEMNELGSKLATTPSEVAKLNLHREALKGLRPGKTGAGMPVVPPAGMAAGMTGPIESVEKLRSRLQGNAKDAYKYEYFSEVFDAQIDIMARVLITGMSRVATFQAGSADNDMIVPVGRGYPHHVTSHGNQATFSMVQNYYFIKMARLMAALDVPDPLDPGKTVLDNTLLVMMAETLPVSHSSNGVPTLTVGKLGGRVRAGTFIKGGGTNKNVMSAVCKAFGTDPVQFGPNATAGVLV
jgi:hypothetical protein